MAPKNNDQSDMNKLSGVFMAVGILFVLFGMIAIILPVLTSLMVDLLFGILLMVCGFAQILLAFLSRKWTGFLFLLLAGIIFLIGGFFFLAHPLPGLVTLTLLIALLLIVGGLIRSVFAFSLRPNWHWEWMLFDGLISLLLGFLILLGWPTDAVWVVGLLFGIDLLFGGITFLMLSSAAKEEA